MEDMIPFKDVLRKLKRDSTLIVGESKTEKNGSVWIELINPESGKVDSYVLKSALNAEMYPSIKNAFKNVIYGRCMEGEIYNMNAIQIQMQINEKLQLRQKEKELERFRVETELRQEELDVEEKRIARNNTRMKELRRSPIPIKMAIPLNK